MLLLLLGAAGALMRGLDWHEAAILIFVFFLMMPIRRHLTRDGSLMHISLSHEWAALIAIALIGSTWLGFFAYRHVEYSNELFWQFSFSARGGAARFLRALAVSAAVLALYILYRFITDAKPRRIAPPTTEEIAQARAITVQSGDPRGYLALLEDKNLLWSDDRQAFIMYAITPNYWIAMGDPVGKRESFEALAWKFRETANIYHAQAVFYQVSDRFLPLYLDLGMVMVKIGENAHLHLADFSLAGGKRENQRKGRTRFLKQGYTFRMLTPDELDAAMPRLREISDRWLGQKMAKEKGFSLGFFNEDYVRQTHVGVVEHEGVIEAFSNIWPLDNKNGLALDLMRYDPETAPVNMMEFLTVEIILWAQAEGYEWFDLGMAPLSGLEKHPLAPLWHKIGNVIFEHGEDFYNFEGLYAYKSKFGPEWQPRYLAAPSGLRIPMVLMSVASVISGGLQGVFRK
jgi:phosphatidylglycerol lysyltransferase